MKRIILIAAAIGAMAACAKTTEVYDDSAEVTLQPFSYVQVKGTGHNGPVSGTAYPAEENFNVFAGHTASDAGTQFADETAAVTPYLTNVEFAKKDASWGGNGVAYYWPKTGSLYFAGFSPARAVVANAEYSFTKDAAGLTLTGFVQGDYAAETNKDMVDLMWFEPDASANSGAPAVLFKHALSYITFNFSADKEQLFTLKKVTLKGVSSKGNFTSVTKAAWTPSAEQADVKDIVVYDGAGEALTATVFTRDNLLIIPQAILADGLEIVYDQHSYAGSTEVITNTQSFKLTGGDGSADLENWLMGKHYTYNFKFSTGGGEGQTDGEILLTPSVEDWTPVKSTDTEIN